MSNLRDNSGFPEIALETVGLIYKAAIGQVGMRREFFHRLSIFCTECAFGRQQGGLQRGRGKHLQISPADIGIGILGRDHLALFGEPDRTLHCAGWLSQDGLITRPAATTDRSAPAMKNAESDPIAPAYVDQRHLGLVKLP